MSARILPPQTAIFNGKFSIFNLFITGFVGSKATLYGVWQMFDHSILTYGLRFGIMVEFWFLWVLTSVGLRLTPHRLA